ncbi:MAG: hypothetical protein KA369_00015 [Spirochaetes bacterium]|nr:hypothetical protein [Spirochaetota bacterium]
MATTGFFNNLRRTFSPSRSPKGMAMAVALAIAVLSAGSCYDDASDTKSLENVPALESILNSEATDVPESLESSEMLTVPDSAGGTITVSFNVPSMKNARVHGFIFDSRGAFRGEIGYNEIRRLNRGRITLAARRATSGYGDISTEAADMFPDGTYTIHGRFDIHSDGFDSAQGDKGFRVGFAVNGNTVITIAERDIISPCFELITSSNRADLKFATVYAYMYFPGGDPLNYYVYRFDGGTSYVKLNHYGNDLGNTMSEDLNAGAYDVLIIADMDDSIDDPSEPSLTNGDKYAVVKNMTIDGKSPIDITGYSFKTFISDVLPAPRVSLQSALNAVTITIRNMTGAVSFNVYGRSIEGYSLIGTIAVDESGDCTVYNDFGPNNEYDIYGLPADTRLYYRIAAVKSSGAEGRPSQWASVQSGGVEKPYIYGDRTVGETRLDLAVSLPRYCQEIEITARSGSCGGSIIGTYTFTVSDHQRDRGIYFSLTDFPLNPDAAYAFTVRGRNMYGRWSDSSACYLIVVQP